MLGSLRVLFDSSVTDFDRGGTSRYVASLLPRLHRLGATVDEVSMRAAWPWSARLPRHARILLHDLAWIPRGSVVLGRARHADLYHGAGFKVAPRAPFRTSVTIHDDTPWDDPPTARLYNRFYMRRVLEAAAPNLAGAITTADATAEAIAGRLPILRPRLHVAPLGVDHDLFRARPAAEIEATLRQLGADPPFVLLVGPYGSRKNLGAMLRALGKARDATPGLGAVVVGRHDPIPDGTLPLVRAGRVDDDRLAGLYGGAELLLFASLKEGFGLPIVEAMACGCPVLTSRGTVLEEIGGDAVALADPNSETDLASACRRLLTDAGERRRLAAAGLRRATQFTWEETARLTVAAWEKMLA
ncbi:MAG TPA: glycosyltransferase family 1 protein [Candidatus Dormibacteraeota bacterium]|jgi:glycosyltransferase involved in cell wall biosynthesis